MGSKTRPRNVPFKNIFMLMVTILSFVTSVTSSTNKSPPNIILIIADDLGWNDVPWHNSRVVAPNLSSLALNGIILNQSYVQPVCTPSRSALLTGKYPFTTGEQTGVPNPLEPVGLSLNTTLISESLKEAGYSTHIVGKWHQGFCSWNFTPTYRGFDSFFGYYNSAEDYYSHRTGVQDNVIGSQLNYIGETVKQQDAPFDFRNNTEPYFEAEGQYSTYLYADYIEDLLESRDPNQPMFLYLPFQSVHTPNQVPDHYTLNYTDIEDVNRRTYLVEIIQPAPESLSLLRRHLNGQFNPFKSKQIRVEMKQGAMVTAMDEAIGRIVASLKSTGHYDNSIIVFSTDNGANSLGIGTGNNWPLRGNKATLWEGGTRGVGFIHSPLLQKPGTVSNQLIHITDWLPTLVGVAGGVVPQGIDGIDQWAALQGLAPSPRKNMIYNIDETQQVAAIRMGDWKLLLNEVNGTWNKPPEGISKKFSLQDNLINREEGNSDEENSEEGKNEDKNTATKSRTEKVTIMETFKWNGIREESFLKTKDWIEDAELNLFNIANDPEERNDLKETNPEIVLDLLEELRQEIKRLVPPNRADNDFQGHPIFHHNIWSPGWC